METNLRLPVHSLDPTLPDKLAGCRCPAPARQPWQNIRHLRPLLSAENLHFRLARMDGTNGQTRQRCSSHYRQIQSHRRNDRHLPLLIGTDKYNDPFYLIGNILMFIASVLTIWSILLPEMAWERNSNKF